MEYTDISERFLGAGTDLPFEVYVILRGKLKIPIRLRTVIFILAVSMVFSVLERGSADLRWPINRPKRITGTFGEYRSVRFHHGLDISCGGRKGYQIYAADDGYVSSVMYQKWGIGYAIFLKHKNGYYTFYGHLDKFSRIILKNKKVRQYASAILNRQDFRIDFDTPEIPVKRGIVIGYSGDSGLGIEHFHFELRDNNNDPLNPLRFGFKVKDNTAPVIEELYLVPLDSYSHIDGYSFENVYNVIRQRGSNLYRIDTDRIPIVAGRIGLKVKVYDHVGYRNRVSPYGIEYYINNRKQYRLVFDKIYRRLTHKMGLYYDYDNTDYSHFTYFLFSRMSQREIIKTDEYDENLNVKIACFDASGNRSVLMVPLERGTVLKIPDYHYEPNFFPGRDLKLRSRDRNFSIEYGENAAFYREMITLETDPTFTSYVRGLTLKSRVYSVTPTNLCINRPALITIKYRERDYKKVGIYALTGGRRSYYFISDDYKPADGVFTVKTLKMGSFFLIRDDSPPVVWYRGRRRPRIRSSIRFYVKDVGSGIDLSRVFLRVDGKKVFWDYDPDKRYIEILPHNNIWRKGRHTVVIQVQDRSENKSRKRVFRYTI